MDSDDNNYEDIYCSDDDEYRVYCEVCDYFCIERFYKKNRNQKIIKILFVKNKYKKNFLFKQIRDTVVM